MDADANSDMLQLAYLLFEEFETSNSAKCEALVTVLTTLLVLSPRRAPELPQLLSGRLQKWFEKAKDERIAILLGEGLAIATRKLGLVAPADSYNHPSEKHLGILRNQVSRNREAMLPVVNDEGLLEYAPEIQNILDGTTLALLTLSN